MKRKSFGAFPNESARAERCVKGFEGYGLRLRFSAASLYWQSGAALYILLTMQRHKNNSCRQSAYRLRNNVASELQLWLRGWRNMDIQSRKCISYALQFQSNFYQATQNDTISFDVLVFTNSLRRFTQCCITYIGCVFNLRVLHKRIRMSSKWWVSPQAS